MVCGKCTLHETAPAVRMSSKSTTDGKTIKYYLVQNDVAKAAHGAVCGGDSEKVTVTGTIEEKDGKQVMTPTKN